MNFQTAVQTCLAKKYMDFNGRAARSEYWWFILFCVIVEIVAKFIHPIVYFIVLLAFILPSIAVLVRRLHDTDRSGWWALIGLIPIIGGLILLYFAILEGNKAPNQYGAPTTLI